MVRKFNAQKGDRSVASNLLKQMNSKMGVDNYTLKVDKRISKRTMLIGIDVCHKPKKSIVGICGSINASMMQYNSQYIIQDKNQEIVENLGVPLQKIFDAYKANNNNNLPDHIIVYRDGVGDSMREQILEKEVFELT